MLAGEDSEVMTDAEGRYQVLVPLQNRPRAVVKVKSAKGYEVEFASYPERRSSHAIEWVQADTHVAQVEKNFSLAMDSARLYGRITDEKGQPISGVQIKVANTTGWHKSRGHETFPDRTTTDAQGRYEIDNIPVKAGYRVSHLMEGERWSILGYVNIAEEREVEANFTLGEASIRGRFVHRDDGRNFRPSRRSCARMGAERIGSNYFVHPRCYDDGRFEFPALAPGRYKLHNRIAWMDSPLTIVPKEVEVQAGQVLEDVKVQVEGEESDTWKVRVTDMDGRFLSDLYVRHNQGGTKFTSSLGPGSDGVARFSLSRLFTQVHIDASGHESEQLNLAGRDPEEVIVVRMRKLQP